MGRKDAARFIAIEKRLDKIEHSLEGVRGDHYYLNLQYHDHMAKIRDLLTDIIESE